MYFKIFNIISFLILVLFLPNYSWAQISIDATGNQVYCPLTTQPIVTNFNLNDVSGNPVTALYIQISTGYKNGEDKLSLPITHPNITSSWSSLEGKLTLKSTGTASYTDFIAAVYDVVYESTNPSPNGERLFSFTIGSANYLPSTGHYYEFVPNVGIPWKNAKIAAEGRNYYGLQGYLATITSREEAQLTGEQAQGAGWIGGSDATTEGVWRWVTGPENGKSFWFGSGGGTTVGTDIPFAFWNAGEPNQTGDEDYAHITAPGVGILGSWNDLSNTGSTSGDYQPKGYMVEYGGMPGDPLIDISASSRISFVSINSTTSGSSCGTGTVSLAATASLGATVLWFDSLTNGNQVGSGTNFSTPTITTTTTYYALASPDGICETGQRTPVIATIYTIPTITSVAGNTVCEGDQGILRATSSSTTATINWYSTPTSSIPIYTGDAFPISPIFPLTTYYVDATENGCTTPTRTEVKLEVLENNYIFTNANISLNDIVIADDSNNNTITINNSSGINDYEYALDSFEEFQEIPFFENVDAGIHSIFFRDKNNCSISMLEVYVLGYPKFFTPNGDGENDFWSIKGLNTDFYPISLIYIYDRFGKILGQIDATSEGWDGLFNGFMLPSSDYWFYVQLIDASGNIREKRGHFSLIRR